MGCTVPASWWQMGRRRGPSGDMPCLISLSTTWRGSESALSAAGGVRCWYPGLLSRKTCTGWRNVLTETSCSSTRTYKSSASGNKDVPNSVVSFQCCGWQHGPDLQTQPWGGWHAEAPQEPTAAVGVSSWNRSQGSDPAPLLSTCHTTSTLLTPVWGPSVPGTHKPDNSSMESTLGWGLQNLSCEMTVQGLLSLEKRHFQENSSFPAPSIYKEVMKRHMSPLW